MGGNSAGVQVWRHVRTGRNIDFWSVRQLVSTSGAISEGLYGLSNGIKASRYRHTKNNSRAVNTSAGGKPSGAMSA